MPRYLTAAAAALAGFVITASVASANPRDVRPSDAATPTAAATAKAQKNEQRYCVVDTVTGSRIPVRQCKTLREWKAEGVDPLNP